MPKHKDFEKIYKRFIKQYGAEKGKKMYYAWINKKGYDDTKPFPRGKEKKERMCIVRGVEIKETDKDFHIEGLIATSHIDRLDEEEDIDIPDRIPKITLESFANQINTLKDARVMGVFHSEGRPFNAEYFGEADVENNPAKVIPLNDGEWGLFVDTKLLKNDPRTPEIIERFKSGDLNAHSITYDTNGFLTTDFNWVGDTLVRELLPETRLFGYTASNTNRVVNPQALASSFGFKEFKELVGQTNKMEVVKVTKKELETKEEEKAPEAPPAEAEAKAPEEKAPEEQPPVGESSAEESAEQKEFRQWKKEKMILEEKEKIEKTAELTAEKVVGKMEIKEKVLKQTDAPATQEKPVALELKEFREVITRGKEIEIKEQFRRGAAACEAIGLDWQKSFTPAAEAREYKSFGVNGRDLEYKALGVTTNQNADTDYLQSSAELQDVYDPIIYNALNQATLTWNILAKDDYSKKGNNQVQFVLKTAANTSAAFYTGNGVVTGNVTRLKYQTKFKKLQVGVSVEGDMIAAARGGPVSDVFAQEVMDSTMDMLAVLNAALYAEVGLETAAGPIGFEYISDSASNTELYSLTRSTANLLSPAAAADTYINQASAVISMTNLRKAITQAVNEGASKRNLVFFTNPIQGNMLRGKFDDSRRMLRASDTDFGFSTDLFVDGIPVFEDKDCNTDDWWLVDLETHRVAIWVPPTIERLGKTADTEDAFIKMYLAVYNRAPRRLVQIYGCAIS